MPRTSTVLFLLCAVLCALLCAAPASAQEFFMIVNGRVSSTADVTIRQGDRVVANIDGQSVAAQIDATGGFEGLTIIRTVNTPDPITFSLRRGSTTYAFVRAEGDTQPITEPYTGFNNPLSAAFSPTIVNGFVGPRLSGGGGDGDGNGQPGGNDGDSADVDGDGVITTNDARLILRFIVGMRQGVTDAAVFDVDGNGVINTSDVVAVLRREGEEAVQPDPGDDGEEEGEGT